MKTFSVRIFLSDGTVLTTEVAACSALDLSEKMNALAKKYPNYVRSEGSLVKEAVIK